MSCPHKSSKYQRLLNKLQKSRVFKSNTETPVQKLEKGEFMFRLAKSSLQIAGRNSDGKILFGSLPLKNNSGNYAVTATHTQPPYKVVYIDQPSAWWPPSAIADSFYQMVDAGFNIINLAFMVDGQPQDMALVWNRELAEPNPDTGKTYRDEILAYAHSKGTSIMLSTGGATEGAFAATDPQVYATNVANFVLATGLDGVDFDLENFSPGLIAPGSTSSQNTINWLISVTEHTRTLLGPYALISHAPQAPYFGAIGNSACWTGPLGGYTAVYYGNQDTARIDFFNVQYYNQGNTNYTTYNTIFINSGNDFPYSAVQQLAQWIPINKFILGKPMQTTDASTGYNTPQEINSIMLSAKNNIGWSNGGIMTWQWCYNVANPEDFARNWLSTATNGY